MSPDRPGFRVAFLPKRVLRWTVASPHESAGRLLNRRL